MKEKYRESILDMLSKIENEHFLNQIWTLLAIHMEKRGDDA